MTPSCVCSPSSSSVSEVCAARAAHYTLRANIGTHGGTAAALCVLGGDQPTVRVGGTVEVEAKGDLSQAAIEAGAKAAETLGRVLGTVVSYSRGNDTALISFGSARTHRIKLSALRPVPYIAIMRSIWRMREEVEALKIRWPLGALPGSTLCKVAGRQTPPLTIAA